MKAMQRRIAALEVGNATNLSPAAKAWLGWPLTEAEQQALDDPEPTDIDASKLSAPMKAWLGID